MSKKKKAKQAKQAKHPADEGTGEPPKKKRKKQREKQRRGMTTGRGAEGAKFASCSCSAVFRSPTRRAEIEGRAALFRNMCALFCGRLWCSGTKRAGYCLLLPVFRAKNQVASVTGTRR